MTNYFTQDHPYIEFLNGKQCACFQKSHLNKTSQSVFIIVNFVEVKNTSAEATPQERSNCNKRLPMGWFIMIGIVVICKYFLVILPCYVEQSE